MSSIKSIRLMVYFILLIGEFDLLQVDRDLRLRGPVENLHVKVFKRPSIEQHAYDRCRMPIRLLSGSPLETVRRRVSAYANGEDF